MLSNICRMRFYGTIIPEEYKEGFRDDLESLEEELVEYREQLNINEFITFKTLKNSSVTVKKSYIVLFDNDGVIGLHDGTRYLLSIEEYNKVKNECVI